MAWRAELRRRLRLAIQAAEKMVSGQTAIHRKTR
jgi:hypothetical protein